MLATGERIAFLRNKKGYNQTNFAEAIKISRSVLNRIELGTRPVRDDELKIIANKLEVSADYLIGNDIQEQNFKSSNTYSTEEKAIIDKYRQLDERGKRRVMRSVNDEYNDMLEDKKIREREIS